MSGGNPPNCGLTLPESGERGNASLPRLARTGTRPRRPTPSHLVTPHPAGRTCRRPGSTTVSSNLGGFPFGQGANPRPMSHRPISALLNSEHLRQNESDNDTVTVGPFSNVGVTARRSRLKYRSRSLTEMAIPYPAPDGDGLPFDHPLPLIASLQWPTHRTSSGVLEAAEEDPQPHARSVGSWSH